jgi:hypothetical protein
MLKKPMKRVRIAAAVTTPSTAFATAPTITADHLESLEWLHKITKELNLPMTQSPSDCEEIDLLKSNETVIGDVTSMPIQAGGASSSSQSSSSPHTASTAASKTSAVISANIDSRNPTNDHHKERAQNLQPSSSTATVRSSAASKAVWFSQWQKAMSASVSFRRLLEEVILPVLQRHPLLPVPEDARVRDTYACIFTLEVVLAVELAEPVFRQYFEVKLKQRELLSDTFVTAGALSWTSQSRLDSTSTSTLTPASISTSTLIEERGHRSASNIIAIFRTIQAATVSILHRLHIVPQMVTERDIDQLLLDVTPTDILCSPIKDRSVTAANFNPDAGPLSTLPADTKYGANINDNLNSDQDRESLTVSRDAVIREGVSSSSSPLTHMLLPQWEWILCVVAFKAVVASSSLMLDGKSPATRPIIEQVKS